MSTSGTAPAYRRLSVDKRRAQLITIALDLFAHYPPEEISLDSVATKAGVSRPLVYRYFPGGKQQLYEAALRSAADELEQCFAEPEEGPLLERLSRALERYLAFVDGHATGFTALLQGGSMVETSRTNAIVDEVRRHAAAQIYHHLGLRAPGPRLGMAVRTWIAAVESASLIWLDEERKPSLEELRRWLVHHFVGLLCATAVYDEQSAEVARTALGMERPDGPAAELLRGLVPLAGDAAHLLGDLPAE